jgi:hypothetical protein
MEKRTYNNVSADLESVGESQFITQERFNLQANVANMTTSSIFKSAMQDAEL